MLLQCFALVIQLTYMYTYLQTSRLIYICCYIDNLPNCSRQDIDKEISELKMSVNTRGRLVATEFLKQFIWILLRVHPYFWKCPWRRNKMYMWLYWKDCDSTFFHVCYPLNWASIKMWWGLWSHIFPRLMPPIVWASIKMHHFFNHVIIL
jgi:hypothetical protein